MSHETWQEQLRRGSLDLAILLTVSAGPRYGLACELSLKMKEMSISHSEPSGASATSRMRLPTFQRSAA